jgi:hypothetical protein
MAIVTAGISKSMEDDDLFLFEDDDLFLINECDDRLHHEPSRNASTTGLPTTTGLKVFKKRSPVQGVICLENPVPNSSHREIGAAAEIGLNCTVVPDKTIIEMTGTGSHMDRYLGPVDVMMCPGNENLILFADPALDEWADECPIRVLLDAKILSQVIIEDENGFTTFPSFEITFSDVEETPEGYVGLITYFQAGPVDHQIH